MRKPERGLFFVEPGDNMGDEWGFTLLEILITFFLFAIMASVLFTSYTGVFKVVKETDREAEAYQMARVAMERIIEDLESTYMLKHVPTTGGDPPPLARFLGEKKYYFNRRADSVKFPSRAHISFDPKAKSTGLALISYYLKEKDDEEEYKELVLYRDDKSGLGEAFEEDPEGFPLCESIHAMAISYSDDEKYQHDEWDSADPAFGGQPPQFVSVRLELMNLNNPEKPYLFETNIMIPFRH